MIKQYRLFRSADGGVMIQHPDNADAMADGATLARALNIMREIETAKGLDHLTDQLLDTQAQFIEAQ